MGKLLIKRALDVRLYLYLGYIYVGTFFNAGRYCQLYYNVNVKRVIILSNRKYNRENMLVEKRKYNGKKRRKKTSKSEYYS